MIEPDMKLRDRRDNAEQRRHCALVRYPRPFLEIPLLQVPIEIFAGLSLRMKRYFTQLLTKYNFFPFTISLFYKVGRFVCVHVISINKNE